MIEPRPFREADTKAVADLWYRSWLSSGAEHGEGVTATVLEQRLFDENWMIHVVEGQRTILAFIAFEENDAVVAQIFVDPQHQGRGLGATLMDFAKVQLPDGISLRTNEENRRARCFYERHGLTLDHVEGGRAYYCWTPDEPPNG